MSDHSTDSRHKAKNPNEKTSSKTNSGNESTTETADQYEVRFEKLERLLKVGENPYLNTFERTDEAGPVSVLEVETNQEKSFRLAGRVRSKRMMGKAGFMDLEDDSGRIQLYGAAKTLEDSFEILKSLDLGDIIGVEGTLFTTKTGQTTLNLSSLTLLSKCLRPLPVVKEADGKVFDAFVDREQRYRMRYVDLIVNPGVRKTFYMRSKIIQEIRSFLTERGFLEVETPMMQPIPGGAAARPFITHHNALDMELFLRIAPELYLKRLIVGGFPRVFELNRNFRNEGISLKHNPEFTMLEIYEAYSNMEGMMDLFEKLIVHLLDRLIGSRTIAYGNHTLNLDLPWKRSTYVEVIREHSGIDFSAIKDVKMALQEAQKAGIPESELKDAGSVWKVAEIVFDEKVEANLIQPILITHFPRELSPLAKVWKEDPEYVERFEPYVAGREIGNAFSELNDPIDQKQRFEAQVAMREAGDEEGGYMDHDYIRALEYGLPPTGGLGIGIDRLVMLLTDTHSIRDTILFPLLRAEKDSSADS